MFKNALLTFLEYFTHASTYKGIFSGLTSLGILTISPDIQGLVTASALWLIGLIQIFVDDKDVDKKSAVIAYFTKLFPAQS